MKNYNKKPIGGGGNLTRAHFTPWQTKFSKKIAKKSNIISTDCFKNNYKGEPLQVFMDTDKLGELQIGRITGPRKHSTGQKILSTDRLFLD